MKSEREYTNAQILNILGDLKESQVKKPDEDPEEMDTWRKRLPVKILLAKNRTLQEVMPIASTFLKTMEEMASKHGMKPAEFNKSMDPEIKAERVELLNEKVSVRIYTFPEKILDMCDGERYDVLTDADVCRIMWLVEEE